MIALSPVRAVEGTRRHGGKEEESESSEREREGEREGERAW